MKVETKLYKGVLLAKVEGEFDMHVAAAFKEAVDECVGRDAKDLVVNLRDVPFIDSSGIGALLGRYRRIEHIGGKMLLVGACVAVERILRLSGVLQVMELCSDEQQALSRV